MTDDALVPFVFEGAAVRGACVRMDRAVHDALASHDYPRALARVLAELLAASTLLAASLKFRGSLIVQLAGGGPVRLAVVECDHALGSESLRRKAIEAVPRTDIEDALAPQIGESERSQFLHMELWRLDAGRHDIQTEIDRMAPERE